MSQKHAGIAALGSRIGRFVAAGCACAALGLAALSFAAPSEAFADDRIEVRLYDENDMTSTEDELADAIAAAGSVPTRIFLGEGDTMISKTVVIPAGADIELRAYEPTALWDVVSTLNRADGFTGVMVKVEKGGKLTLSNSGDHLMRIYSRGQWVSSSQPTVLVNGGLVMESGAIEGARGGSGTWEGAVTVTGEGARFTMNGGSVTDNRRLPDPTRAQQGAGNVAVSNGGSFTMNGGTISKGYGSGEGTSSYDYGEVGGLGVFKGGHAVINGGEFSENHGFAGAMSVFNWIYGDELARIGRDGAEACRATAEIKGGSFINNVSGFGGGALLVFGNAAVEMSGGEMKGNTAPNGGAVNAMSLYSWGASYTWQEVDGEGAASGLAKEEFNKRSPGSFHMTGGTISGNTAKRTGGGVNVVSDGVFLEGGVIADNSAAHMGGGVYVATKSYTARFHDAVIHDNSATGGSAAGGGIWTCPTGSLTLHVTNGAAVMRNKADSFGDDIAHLNYGGSGAQPMYLEDRVLGGAPVKYYLDGSADGGPRFDPANPGEALNLKGADSDLITNKGLKAVVGDEGFELASGLSKLDIHGNTARLGGGVGSNGHLVFGEKPTFDMHLDKAWKGIDALTEADRSLSENGSADGAVDGASAPADTLRFALYLVHDGKEHPLHEAWFADDGGIASGPFVMKKEDGWKLDFTDLPTVDGDGNKLVYRIVEVSEAGDPVLDAEGKRVVAKEFTCEDANDDGTGNDALSRIVVNELASMNIEKQWLTGGVPAEAGSIKDESVRIQVFGTNSSEPISFTKDAAASSFRFDLQGQVKVIEVSRDAGWKASISNLPVYDATTGQRIEYSVREVDAEGKAIKDGVVEKLESGNLHAVVVNEVVPPEEPPVPPTPPTPPNEPPVPSEPPTPSNPPAPPADKPRAHAVMPATGDASGQAAAAFAGLVSASAAAVGAAFRFKRRFSR